MQSIPGLLLYAINIYQILILVRVLMSWIPNSQNNRFGQIIYQLTEPLLGSLRRILPNAGIFDLSPLIAFFLLGLLQQFLAGQIN